MRLKGRNETLDTHLKYLKNENSGVLSTRLNDLQEISNSFSVFKRLESHFMKSPNCQENLILKLQELSRENMDLKIEAQEMETLKLENKKLRELLGDRMTKIVDATEQKFTTFESQFQNYYKETIFYQKKENLDYEKNVLKDKVHLLEKERTLFANQKLEAERNFRKKEIESEMLKMELRRLREDNKLLEHKMEGRLNLIHQFLGVSIPIDYSYRNNQNPIHILEEIGSPIEENNFIKNESPEIKELTVRTRRNLRRRIVGEETQPKKKKKAKRKTNKRKKKVTPVKEILETPNSQQGGQKLFQKIFDSMRGGNKQ